MADNNLRMSELYGSALKLPLTFRSRHCAICCTSWPRSSLQSSI